ncbi:MAG: HEAT repeat domain-containing protein, partial [Fimbriiglobus sp.]
AALAALVVSPAPAADPVKVREAIQKGAEFLKKTHAPAPTYDGGGHGIGSAALAGLALLEAGTPKSDPALQNILQFVRVGGIRETATYQVALGLVFLDKFGDKTDTPLIQVLGTRLYHGMNAAGGWTYKTWPDVPAPEELRLRAVLYGTKPPPRGKLHPEAARQWNAVRTAIFAAGRTGLGAGDDTSNTQFGLLGLWVAARHGLPVTDAVALIEFRFLRTQSRADGGWAYNAAEAGTSTAAMTCAGLMALAAGAANRERTLAARPEPIAAPDDETPKDPGKPIDPFLNPREAARAKPKVEKPGEEKPDPDKPAEQLPPGVRKAAVEAALAAVCRVVVATPPDGKPGGTPLLGFVGHGNVYYVMWSIERAAVTLGLDTLGNIDWHDWGAAHLLPSQQPDGSWPQANFPATVNTSFAVLFLCKANLLADLGSKLKVKDPGKAELRGGGGANPLFAPAKEPPPVIEYTPPPVAVEEPKGPLLPTVADTSNAITVATRLTKATDEEWPDRLAEARDSRGVTHTLGLSRAVAEVPPARRKETRDALAERLTRMTPATLRGLMRDPDPEIRRAAALATAMKDDPTHIPDLIDRLTDPAESVVRAAAAGLRSFSGKDFGPKPGASAEDKLVAAADWQQWAATRAKGSK